MTLSNAEQADVRRLSCIDVVPVDDDEGADRPIANTTVTGSVTSPTLASVTSTLAVCVTIFDLLKMGSASLMITSLALA